MLGIEMNLDARKMNLELLQLHSKLIQMARQEYLIILNIKFVLRDLMVKKWIEIQHIQHIRFKI